MNGRFEVGTRSERRRSQVRRHRPLFDTVEPRLLLSGFTVTSTDDSGDGTLRQAILDSNSNPGANTISFDIPGTGVQVIRPSSPLPAITNPVVIDGYTQPGSKANTATSGDNATPLIVIDGSEIADRTLRTGLNITADDSTVRGLVVDNFDAIGVLFNGSNDHLEGSFVGVDATGKVGAPNGLGVAVYGGGNVIGGTDAASRNLISSNLAGVGLASLSVGGSSLATATAGNVVQGNLIGTDASGTADLGNGVVGVGIIGPGNVVGGTAPGAANTIAFNGKAGSVLNLGAGVAVAGLDSTSITPTALESTGNLISGNSIYSNHDIGIAQITIPTSTLMPLLNFSTASLPTVLANVLTNIQIGPSATSPATSPMPALTSATNFKGVTTVLGTLTGTAGKTYQLQFFGGAGQTFLGETSVTAGASGSGAIAFVAPSSVGLGQVITATSIDPTKNTSQFSNAVTVANPAPPTLAPIANQTVNEGSTITLAAAGSDANTSEALTYSASAGTINPTTGAFSYTAASGPATKTVTITVSDQSSPAQTASQSFTINVLDVAPTVSLGGNTTIQAGNTLAQTGSFADPGAQTWTATVDYGDGSGPTPLALNANKTFALSHVYSTAGTYPVTVKVADSGGASGSATFNTTVIPRPVQVTAPINLTVSKNVITGISVSYGGAVSGADNSANYELALVTTRRVRHSIITSTKPIVIKGASYNSGSQTATILPGSKLSPTKVYQLTIIASGIHDAYGQALDGNHDGIAGGNLVATIAKRSVTILKA